MPFVNVKLIEGVFDAVTWVVVEEVRSGDWGIGGKALATEDVQALAAGTVAYSIRRAAPLTCH
jgi:4-oxalocrotonate tautomerase